jgi:ADP-heptose:LPS heptosyltransferase
MIAFDTALVKHMLKRGNLLALREVISFGHKLRGEHYDKLIILQPQLSLLAAARMAFFCLIIGAKERIGRNTDGRGFFLTRKYNESTSTQEHEVGRMLKLIKMVGPNTNEISLELSLTNFDRFNARKLINLNNGGDITDF